MANNFRRKTLQTNRKQRGNHKRKKNRIRGMRMQMEYQFIIAYFCERPHSKIKIRPSRLETLFNLLKILLSVTRITITTGHAYFFHTIVRPSRGNSWLSHNFYVAELAQQRLLWNRIRGFGDPRIQGSGDAIYVRIRYMGISQYALLCSAADAFSHGFE